MRTVKLGANLQLISAAGGTCSQFTGTRAYIHDYLSVPSPSTGTGVLIGGKVVRRPASSGVWDFREQLSRMFVGRRSVAVGIPVEPVTRVLTENPRYPIRPTVGNYVTCSFVVNQVSPSAQWGEGLQASPDLGATMRDAFLMPPGVQEGSNNSPGTLCWDTVLKRSRRFDSR